MTRGEKEIFRKILPKPGGIYKLEDFINMFWTQGFLEFSTFRQVIQVRAKDAVIRDQSIASLVRAINFIRKFEKAGMISSWSEMPLEDNTFTIGKDNESYTSYLLPDTELAAELLKYGNRKFVFGVGIKDYLKSNSILPVWLLPSFFTIILIGIGALLFNIQMILERNFLLLNTKQEQSHQLLTEQNSILESHETGRLAHYNHLNSTLDSNGSMLAELKSNDVNIGLSLQRTRRIVLGEIDELDQKIDNLNFEQADK
jgi:hypothetical protein